MLTSCEISIGKLIIWQTSQFSLALKTKVLILVLSNKDLCSNMTRELMNMVKKSWSPQKRLSSSNMLFSKSVETMMAMAVRR